MSFLDAIRPRYIKVWEPEALEQQIQTACKQNPCEIIQESHSTDEKVISSICFAKDPLWFGKTRLSPSRPLSAKIEKITGTKSITLKLNGTYLSLLFGYGSPIYSIKKRHIVSSYDGARNEEIIDEIFRATVRNLFEEVSIINETPYDLKIDNQLLLSGNAISIIPSDNSLKIQLDTGWCFSWAEKFKYIHPQFFKNEEALHKEKDSQLRSILPCQVKQHSLERSYDFPIEREGASHILLDVSLERGQLNLNYKSWEYFFRWVSKTHQRQRGEETCSDERILFCGIEKRTTILTNDSGIPLEVKNPTRTRIISPKEKMEAGNLCLVRIPSYLSLHTEEYSSQQLPLKTCDIEAVVKICLVEEKRSLRNDEIKIRVHFVMDKERHFFLKYQKEEIPIEKIRKPLSQNSLFIKEKISRKEILQEGLYFRVYFYSGDNTKHFTLFEPQPTEGTELKEGIQLKNQPSTESPYGYSLEEEN